MRRPVRGDQTLRDPDEATADEATPMRRRLTLAIVALVAGTVLVTSVASYFLIRHDSLTTSQHQLSAQAQAISQTLSSGIAGPKVGFRRELRVVEDTGALTGIDVVALTPGRIHPGPPAGGYHPPRCWTSPPSGPGRQTVGHTSSLLIYATIPTPLTKVTEIPSGPGHHPTDPRAGRRHPVLRPGRPHRVGPVGPGGGGAGPAIRPAGGGGGDRHPTDRLGGP